MADTNLPSTPADGNIKTVLVPIIDDVEAPTLTELNAASAIDISCYLTAGGFAFTVDQATITDERECDTITRGAPGRKTPSLTITGIDNTNTAYDPDQNELVLALEEGSRWFAVRRRGKSHTEAFAVGEVVTVTDFVAGVGAEVPAEANSVLRSQWNAFVNQFANRAEVVAGA